MYSTLKNICQKTKSRMAVESLNQLFLALFKLPVRDSFCYYKEIRSCLKIKPSLEEKIYVSRIYAYLFTFLNSSLYVSTASHKRVLGLLYMLLNLGYEAPRRGVGYQKQGILLKGVWLYPSAYCTYDIK